jgi:hypothetical protein
MAVVFAVSPPETGIRVCVLTGKNHRGKRSLSSQIRKTILRRAYIDRILCEKINRLTPADVIAEVSRMCNEPVFVADCQVEVGEVLVDTYGRGTFQRVQVNGSR